MDLFLHKYRYFFSTMEMFICSLNAYCSVPEESTFEIGS